jgi:hypothetical protein
VISYFVRAQLVRETGAVLSERVARDLSQRVTGSRDRAIEYVLRSDFCEQSRRQQILFGGRKLCRRFKSPLK